MFCAVLYMELSYTGSTRASEHVIVQIGSVFIRACHSSDWLRL